MADEERVNDILRLRERLRSKRSQWDHHFNDLTRVMLTRRRGFQETLIEGDDRNEDIFDGTAMQSARSLANTLVAMSGQGGIPDFSIRIVEDNINQMDEAKAWLQGLVMPRLKAALLNPKARFLQARGEVILDLVILGTGIKFSGESRNLEHLLFQSIHLKDADIMFNEEGNPEGVFITRRYSIRNAAMKFGEANLSKASREKIEQKKADETIEILHVVIPRDEIRFTSPLFAKNMPIADLWIEVDAKHLIRKSGFMEFPFAIPRWDTTSGETYGRSPGMVALPDTNTSQAMGETLLIAGQRAADPPLMAPNDNSFDEVNAFPGGLGYYDVETAAAVGGNPFFPLVTGSNIPLTREMQNDTRINIKSAFFKDILNLPSDGPQMTATEVIQRIEQYIREIGPVYGRLETDLDVPTIERPFKIMLRAGSFDPIPEILQGHKIIFEFESPIVKIRKKAEAAAAKMLAAEIIELAQARPEALDLLNVDALIRFSAETKNVPYDIILGRDVVDQIRQQRAQAQAEQAQAMKGEATMRTIESVSKSLKNVGIDKAAAQELQGAGV